MGTFYKEMSSKDDLAGALRTAKLELLHSNSFWKRPYYWGALPALLQQLDSNQHSLADDLEPQSFAGGKFPEEQ